MQIVASHNSLDFDSLAAQLAVTKLYPSARMALCLPALGNIRDFLTLYRNHLPLTPIKHLQDKEISKIFIVDCQHIDRLDPFVRELIQGGTPYVVFDHHQADKEGLVSKAESDSMIECVGAATTLLVEKIQQQEIKLTDFESTLLALGIYEDTGCLTYGNTTERDAACIAFLLKNGADLQIINEYMRTKLSGAQQALFEELVSKAKIITLAGNKIVLAAATCTDFIDGLATLIRKLMDVESADIAFISAYMRDRVYLVGRSDIPTVSVREIVRLYGGDGHIGAGAAVIKDETKTKNTKKSSEINNEQDGNYLSTKVLSDIELFLREHIHPEMTAAQIMSTPVKIILPSVSMDEAGKIMIRHNLDGLLVAENKEILGVVSKRDVDQAHHHKLGHAPVLGFMSRPVITVNPETTFSEIQSILVRNNIGRLPVLSKKGDLLGIISRNDVLRTLFDKSSSSTVSSTKHSNIKHLNTKQVSLGSTHSIPNLTNIGKQLTDLDPADTWLYHEIGSVAAQLNMVAYAVGGSVRDMLLGLTNFDLDFVVEKATAETSAITLAEKLVQMYPHKFSLLSKHERFQTATMLYLTQEERVIDISTARQEFYEYPAALPTVEPSLLKEDVFRRDFTINTLALSLMPEDFGQLIDYFNGLDDLKAGIVRVLHQFSFIEDPTRILRAARFASRFGFKLDDNTAELARHAIEIGIFDNLAGTRMKEELRLILESPARLAGLSILSKLGARLRYLDEELEYGLEERKFLRRAERMLKHYSVDKDHNWLVYLALLLFRLSVPRLENVLARLHLATEAKHIILRGLEIDKELNELKGNATPSQIYNILHSATNASLMIAASLSKPGSSGRRAIKLYFDELKTVKTELTGKDLLRFGYNEGPELGKALSILLDARLDKKVQSLKEEEDFLRQQVSK